MLLFSQVLTGNGLRIHLYTDIDLALSNAAHSLRDHMVTSQLGEMLALLSLPIPNRNTAPIFMRTIFEIVSKVWQS